MRGFIALHPVYKKNIQIFHYTDLMLVNSSTIHYPTIKDSEKNTNAMFTITKYSITSLQQTST